MQNNQDNHNIEYGEAEPIDPESSIEQWNQQQPDFRVHTANIRSCNPCCGPIGCLVILLLIGYAVAKSQFLQNMILAGIITLALMTVMIIVTKRR